eukprot:1014303-Amphidinium_carterae.1
MEALSPRVNHVRYPFDQKRCVYPLPVGVKNPRPVQAGGLCRQTPQTPCFDGLGDLDAVKCLAFEGFWGRFSGEKLQLRRKSLQAISNFSEVLK